MINAWKAAKITLYLRLYRGYILSPFARNSISILTLLLRWRDDDEGEA